MEVTDQDSLASLLARTEEQFIFIIDEWDALFEQDFMSSKDRQDYILFLRSLLKNQPYVKLALMTGILPIAKYSSGSPLNMFHEFNAFGLIGFEEYYGFSEEEIRELLAKKNGDTEKSWSEGCEVNREFEFPAENPVNRKMPSLEEIRLWYDGYLRRSDGGHVFNPDSVCKALTEGRCKNNWVGTGPMNDISNLIAENAFEIRDDVLRMAAGEEIEVRLDGFGIEDGRPTSREDILAAMVVYGFLTYHDGKLSIPNLELKQKFSHCLRRGTLGVSMTLEESRDLLEATLQGQAKDVAARIGRIHDEQIPFIVYSDENSLACVIMYAYYAASDWYEIRREEKEGRGYVDFLFTPVDHRHIPSR